MRAIVTGSASEPAESWKTAPLPAATVFRVARWRVLAFLLLSSIMTLGGWAVPHPGQGAFMRWVPGGFFMACCLVFLVTLLPGAARIVFTPDGASMRNLYREHRFAWRQMTRPILEGMIPYIPAWFIGRALFAEIVPAGPAPTGKSSKPRRIAIPLAMYGSHKEIERMALAYWHQAQADSLPSTTLDPAPSKD